jgi:hypothetical protein
MLAKWSKTATIGRRVVIFLLLLSPTTVFAQEGVEDGFKDHPVTPEAESLKLGGLGYEGLERVVAEDDGDFTPEARKRAAGILERRDTFWALGFSDSGGHPRGDFWDFKLRKLVEDRRLSLSIEGLPSSIASDASLFFQVALERMAYECATKLRAAMPEEDWRFLHSLGALPPPDSDLDIRRTISLLGSSCPEMGESARI